MRLKRLDGVTIPFNNRNYELGFARWGGGANALLLLNQQTGAIFPASLDGPANPERPAEVHLLDVADLVTVLEQGGIVQKREQAQSMGEMEVARCEIVHPEILSWLAAGKQRDQATELALTDRMSHRSSPSRDGVEMEM